MKNLTISVKTFNEKVKIMNQTGSRQLSLTADEARNLQADIFNLLATLAEQRPQIEIKSDPSDINLDGGGFK